MLIFDASTLILLARIELLPVFLGAWPSQVAIPKEVARECCQNKKKLDAVWIQKMLDEKKIKVLAATNRKFVAKLQVDFLLGTGEAEALALAVAEQADLVGIDDGNGINACKLLGLPFATAAAILVRCGEKELIHRSEALFKLELLASYGRYKKTILEDVRMKLEALP